MSNLATAALIAAGISAVTFPDYLDAFKARYPTTTLPRDMIDAAGAECYVCHLPIGLGQDGNCYRLQLKSFLLQGFNIEQALEMAETLDPDGDGVPSVVEILTRRYDRPRSVGYGPGLVGTQGISPCSPIPGLVVSHRLETPPCRADLNLDTLVDFNDYLQFLNFYNTPDLRADFNNDLIVDFNDYLEFLNAYNAPC